jgi:hypothetical protein
VIKRLGIVLGVLVLLVTATAVQAADIVGRGSIGVAGGVMKFSSGQEFSNGNPRLIGQVIFKYNFTGSLAGILESGYGWNNYDTEDRENKDTLAVVIPTILGLEYRFRWRETKLWPNLAAGAGLYSLGVKDSRRTWARGNNGTERLTWTSPGLFGKLGSEYLFDNAVAMNLDFLYHYIFSKDEEKFPDMWGNQNTAFWEFRLGVNYYFTLKSSGPAPPSEE